MPVSQRITYMIACVCFNIITGAAPNHLPRLISLHSFLRSLHSSVLPATVVFCLLAASSIKYSDDSDYVCSIGLSSGSFHSTMLLILHPNLEIYYYKVPASKVSLVNRVQSLIVLRE